MATLAEPKIEFARIPHPAPVPGDTRREALADPGFGKLFSDHMVSIGWSEGQGWHSPTVGPRAPVTLDPAAAVLHYAQEIFEGLKAYKLADGGIALVRPEANAARFNNSAARLAMPEMPPGLFVAAIRELVLADRDWFPSVEGGSLYLRPFMFASEAFLGVRPANEVKYLLIASPVAAYFAGGVKPVSIWLSTQYTRAARGGTGAAKCGGNYAASLAPMVEAAERGCEQVCFLDAIEQTWVEELGGMNVYFVRSDGTLVTPESSGTILEGVTRSSILQLGKELGLNIEERRVSIDEWRDGVASGEITEVFACGTAAVITPVGRLVWEDGAVGDPEAPTGPVTSQVRKRLVDVQYGRAEDTHGWMRRLV